MSFSDQVTRYAYILSTKLNPEHKYACNHKYYNFYEIRRNIIGIKADRHEEISVTHPGKQYQGKVHSYFVHLRNPNSDSAVHIRESSGMNDNA